MTLTQELKKLRIEQGISQKEMSRLTGLNDTALSRLESGRGNPTLKTLNKVGKVLGIKLKWDVDDFLNQ